MSAAELRNAMAAMDAETVPSWFRYGRPGEQDMRDIESRSGGLVELVPSDRSFHVVQAVHQSVNGFLLEDGLGLLVALTDHPQIMESTIISPPRAFEAIQISQRALYLSCLRVLSDEAIIGPVTSFAVNNDRELMMAMENRPFLGYSFDNHTKHAKGAPKRREQDFVVERELLNRALPALWHLGRPPLMATPPFGIRYRRYKNVLRLAAASGLDNSVVRTIGTNDNPCSKDEFGWTALHFVAFHGHQTTVKILHDAGLDIQESNSDNETPVLLAACGGRQQVFSWLAMQGANLNTTTSSSETVLHRAAESSNLLISELCIDAGADLNAQDSNCGTPLHVAAFCGHTEVVRLLLDAGADVNVRSRTRDTALQEAVFSGGGIEVIHLLINAGADVNAQGGARDAALIQTARYNCLEIIRLLLSAGADVNVRGEACCTALIAAAWYGSFEIVRLLLNNGADINAQGGVYGIALHGAAYNGEAEVVHLLLDAGADANIQGGEYGTALQAAAVSTPRRLGFLPKKFWDVNPWGNKRLSQGGSVAQRLYVYF